MGTWNSFRRAFFPTEKEKEEKWKSYQKLCRDLAKEKGCSTCKFRIKKPNQPKLPDYILNEENMCIRGLECDTVVFSVKNCPLYKSEEKWYDDTD